MREGFVKENPVIEHLKLLKKHGRLDEMVLIQAVDVLSESGNANLMKDYLGEQSIAIADIILNGKPFSMPDETADGPIRLAIAENNQFIGLYLDECHVLIAGQTGTGKSTLLKIIFAQAILLSERQKGGDNGKHNLLAVR